MNLDTRRLKTLEDIRAFLGGSTQFDLSIADRAAAYRWRAIVKSGVRDLNQAASWSAVFTSIPSLNLTPVITLAR